MADFTGKFTTIKSDFSTTRRLPRLGRIRLGIKVAKIDPITKKPKLGKDNQPVEYPKETPYFVCPEEVRRIYGEQPTELDVMLPIEDRSVVFPQKLAMYGSGKGLKCHGNGETAERYDEQKKAWATMTCPCPFLKTLDNPRGDCSAQAHLMVMLPKVSLGGVYQITTKSFHSVVDINSGMDYAKLIIGRFAQIPLQLKRESRTTHHDGKSQTHYTLSLTMNANIEGVNKLREDTTRILSSARFQIEAPIEENPKTEPPDVVDEGDDPNAEIDEAEVVQLKGRTQQREDGPIPTSPVGVNPVSRDAPAAPSSDKPLSTVTAPDDEATVLAPGEQRQQAIKAAGTGGPFVQAHVDDPGIDAEWLGEVMDCEAFLEGTEQGKGILRSIRGGLKLTPGVYPMLKEEQTEYRQSLKSAVKRMEKVRA